jgi:hypothetical protein
MYSYNNQITHHKCIVIPKVTEIPGTYDKKFQKGEANTPCNNTYHNMSRGANLSYCHVHYEEYESPKPTK